MIIGATSFTVIYSVCVSVGPLGAQHTVAVIAYEAPAVSKLVGVPVTRPVFSSIARPAGSAGLTAYFSTIPPVTVGVFAVMATPFVYTASDALYVSMLGGLSLTASVTTIVSEPPVFVAVMVNGDTSRTPVGVPVISPVVVSKLSPAGRAGLVAKLTTGPPAVEGAFAVMAVFFTYVTGLEPYELKLGTTALTMMVRALVDVPPVLVAVTVYVPMLVTALGVPVRLPELAWKDRPKGRAGLTA